MTEADNNTLFVTNFSWDLTQDDMHQLFSFYGKIENVNLIMDRSTGKSKGFGFVKFMHSEDAITALEGLHDKQVDGRILSVTIARSKEDKIND